MPMHIYAAAFGVSILGSVVQAICGFGYGPVNMSLLPYLMPYSQAVALSGLCGATTGTMVAVTNIKHVIWRIMWPCTLASIVMSGVCVWASAFAADRLMMLLLGGALIAVGVYSIFFSDRIHIRPTVTNGIIAGALSGMMSGLFAVGGPPVALYLIHATKTNDEYRSTLNMHFFLNAFMTTFMRWYNGVFTRPVLIVYALLLVAMAIGVWIGGKIFHTLDQKRLRTIVYGYLIVSGVMMFLK